MWLADSGGAEDVKQAADTAIEGLQPIAGTRFETLSAGSYADIVRMQWQYLLDDYLQVGWGGTGLSFCNAVFWKFLLGLAAGKAGVFDDPDRLWRWAKKLWPRTVTVGLAPGRYAIEGSSTMGAYRRGRATVVVPANATDRCDVRLLLEVQRR